MAKRPVIRPEVDSLITLICQHCRDLTEAKARGDMKRYQESAQEATEALTRVKGCNPTPEEINLLQRLLCDGLTPLPLPTLSALNKLSSHNLEIKGLQTLRIVRD